MKYDKHTARIKLPPGHICGRIADLIYRWMNKKQFVSRLADDCRHSMIKEEMEKLELFGTAGITAKVINSNIILKTIWRMSHKKWVYSTFNEITRILFKRLNTLNRHYSGFNVINNGFVKNCIMNKMRLMPDRGVPAEADVIIDDSKIIVIPKDTARWQNLTAVMLFRHRNDEESRLRLIGSKCKARNTELREKEGIRAGKESLQTILKITEVYRSILQGASGRLEASGTGFKPEIYESVQNEEMLLKAALDLCQKKYFKKRFNEIKEYFGLDYLPGLNELAELEQNVKIAQEEYKYIEEDLRQRSRERVNNERKYMNKRFAAVNVEFTRTDEGYFVSEGSPELWSRWKEFSRYALYPVLYNEDWTGMPAEYSELEAFCGWTGTEILNEYPYLMWNSEFGIRNEAQQCCETGIRSFELRTISPAQPARASPLIV